MINLMSMSINPRHIIVIERVMGVAFNITLSNNRTITVREQSDIEVIEAFLFDKKKERA